MMNNSLSTNQSDNDMMSMTGLETLSSVASTNTLQAIPSVPGMTMAMAMPVANAGNGAAAAVAQPALVRRPSKKQRKEETRREMYLERFAEWARRHLFNTLNSVNQPNMALFFREDSMLTYVNMVAGTQPYNCQGAQAILAQLCQHDQTTSGGPAIFANMKQIHYRMQQAQPMDDKRGISLTCILDVETQTGAMKRVMMTTNMKTYPGKKEQRPRIPNFEGAQQNYAMDGNYTICQYYYNMYFYVCS